MSKSRKIITTHAYKRFIERFNKNDSTDTFVLMKRMINNATEASGKYNILGFGGMPYFKVFISDKIGFVARSIDNKDFIVTTVPIDWINLRPNINKRRIKYEV